MRIMDLLPEETKRELMVKRAEEIKAEPDDEIRDELQREMIAAMAGCENLDDFFFRYYGRRA